MGISRKNVITFTFHDFSSLNIYVTNTQILKYNIFPPMLMSSVVTTGHCVLLLSDWSAGPGQWVSWALIGQWQWSVVWEHWRCAGNKLDTGHSSPPDTTLSDTDHDTCESWWVEQVKLCCIDSLLEILISSGHRLTKSVIYTNTANKAFFLSPNNT